MHGEIYIDDAINWDCPLNRGLLNRWASLQSGGRGSMLRDLRRRRDLSLVYAQGRTGPQGRKGGYGAFTFPAYPSYAGFSAATVDDFTATIWVKATGDAIILGSSVSYPQLRLGEATDKLSYYDMTPAAALSSVVAVPLSTWSMCGWSRAGNTLTFYQNGIAYGSGTFSMAATFNQVIAYTANAIVWDDLCFYARAFSAAEMVQLYQDQLRGSPETLNWYKRKAYSFQDAAPGGNRRRRVICGAA